MALHADSVEDVATASNFKNVKTVHLHLDLDVVFSENKVYGWNTISMESLMPDLQEVILDTHEALEVKAVTFSKTGGEAKSCLWNVGPFASYGQNLAIPLPEPCSTGEKFDITVQFVANPSPGVCWLEPAQTADKTHPMMYTQGQAVLNRSFFPCQDTPAIKSTYSAFVSVPEGLTPVMSVNKSSFGTKANKKGEKNCYFFELDVPVQSYLVALAVGRLESADIGPRSKVWAEPSMLSKAQAEFNGEVERFLQVGEAIFGPYVWTRYDILVMPPSFPFGGMENPCLTFVTPCIVVGDKSLIDVVIHEISHSWFGNLVTNANWSEFWLNEGFTMYAQRRIEEKLFGKAFMCLEANTGQTNLMRHIDREGDDHPLTRLRVIIEKGVDPDETYNETPYEKGFAFLCYLCSLVGEPEKFDAFLKAYVDKFKYKSIVAEDFFDFYLEYFPDLKAQGVQEKHGYEFHKTWLERPGRPPFRPDLSAMKELTEEADKAAEIMTSGRLKATDAPDMSNWQTYTILHFLDRVAESSPLPEGCMKKLATTYPFLAESKNAEIMLRWCEIVIKNNAIEYFENIRTFLKSQGKQKYTKPLYAEMAKGSSEARHLAGALFKETRDQLHVQVRGYVKEILEKEGILFN